MFKLKNILIIGASLACSAGFIYSAADLSNKNEFDEGLKFKVESLADSNKDGHLSIQEMSSVFDVLHLDATKRLHDSGFYLSTQERQEYLRAIGEFDIKTDFKYQIGKTNYNFEKAVSEGRPVHRIAF